MKKYLLLSCFFSFFIFSAFAQELPRVKILNNTGYTIYYVYISQTASDDWEEDVLGDDVLINGESVSVRLSYPLKVANRYDIKLEDEDGDTYTKWNVLITPKSSIEFTIGDLDVTTTPSESSTTDVPSVQIVNNTGYTIYYVYISTTASDDWEEDILGDDVLLNGQYVNVSLLYPLNVVNRYDIKLEDEDGDTYTKWDVLITPSSSIEFTTGDLDVTTTSTTSGSTDLPSVQIVNNTGYTVYYVYISTTASDDWEEDVLGDDVLLDGQSVNVRLSYPLNVVNRYDIKLEDEDGDTYTRWNVLISPDSRIEFTFDDLDD